MPTSPTRPHRHLDAGASWVDPIDALGTLDENGTASSVNWSIWGSGSYQLRYEAGDPVGESRCSDLPYRGGAGHHTPKSALQGLPEITLSILHLWIRELSGWIMDGYGLIEANGLLDLTRPGVYQLDYNHTDQSGNGAEGIFRTIRVIDTSSSS